MEAVILADHDDPDVESILDQVQSVGGTVHWIKLGRPHDEYDVIIDSDRAQIRWGDCLVDLEVIKRSGVVVFRRWKVAPPFPIVEAEIPGDPQRFAEREWEATFRVLFARWLEVSDLSRWSRDPFSIADKTQFLRVAESAGAVVPPFRIASQPDPDDSECVSKAIGADQAVIKGQRYATTRIVRPEMDYLFRGRQPCPVLLQREIKVDKEIRVAYSFGQCGAVLQQRQDCGGDSVDIRYSQVHRLGTPVPEGLMSVFRQFAARSGINLFTADVLLDAANIPWLVDLNPDGLFIAADDEQMTLTSVLTGGIAARLADK